MAALRRSNGEGNPQLGARTGAADTPPVKGSSIKERMAALASSSTSPPSSIPSSDTEKVEAGESIKDRMAKLEEARKAPSPTLNDDRPKEPRPQSSRIADLQATLTASKEKEGGDLPRRTSAPAVTSSVNVSALRSKMRDSIVLPGMGGPPRGVPGYRRSSGDSLKIGDYDDVITTMVVEDEDSDDSDDDVTLTEGGSPDGMKTAAPVPLMGLMKEMSITEEEDEEKDGDKDDFEGDQVLTRPVVAPPTRKRASRKSFLDT